MGVVRVAIVQLQPLLQPIMEFRRRGNPQQEQPQMCQANRRKHRHNPLYLGSSHTDHLDGKSHMNGNSLFQIIVNQSA